MKTIASSPIAQALAQLELERANLAARLEKVDALIVSMRDVFHLPKASATVKEFPRAKPAHTNGHGRVSDDAIRAALAGGPMAPGELADKLGLERSVVRYHVKQLEDAGELVSTGTTMSRRIALRDRPAKEAP
jgi:DNA-binding transcriptional ArsR family regulator